MFTTEKELTTSGDEGARARLLQPRQTTPGLPLPLPLHCCFPSCKLGCRIGGPGLFPESWETLGSRHLGIFHRHQHRDFVVLYPWSWLVQSKRRTEVNFSFLLGLSSPLRCTRMGVLNRLGDSQGLKEKATSDIPELERQMPHRCCCILCADFPGPCAWQSPVQPLGVTGQ